MAATLAGATIRKVDRTGFESLLEYGEASWLDWKTEFPAGLIAGSASPEWEKGKGELLKDLVSIANSGDERPGYLIYGVKDRHTEREVLGIVKSGWDDADFQTWATNTFDPPPRFVYTEIRWDDNNVVGIFTIDHIPEYPHVATQDVVGVIHKGQVWFRRGTQNNIALHQDLKLMFSPPEPYKLERMEGKIFEKTKAHYEALGRAVQWRRFGERDELLEGGYGLAYYPGTRRAIVVVTSSGNIDVILMVRP